MDNKNRGPVNWYAFIMVILVALCSLSFLNTYVHLSFWKFVLVCAFFVLFFVWMLLEIFVNRPRG